MDRGILASQTNPCANLIKLSGKPIRNALDVDMKTAGQPEQAG